MTSVIMPFAAPLVAACQALLSRVLPQRAIVNDLRGLSCTREHCVSKPLGRPIQVSIKRTERPTAATRRRSTGATLPPVVLPAEGNDELAASVVCGDGPCFT